MSNQQLENDEKDQVKFLVSKFQRKGFDGLTLEEVATTMITPDFSKQFNAMTGQDWNAKYEIKSIERLSKAKFDIHWMTRKDGDPHTPLFVNSARGDINKLRQYLKENRDASIKQAVDQQKRGPLHIASMEGRTGTVEFLILSGFNINARDKLLRTPLHYSALYGWDGCCDALLRGGADIQARDQLGRCVAHFASCGPSSILLQLIISSRPELVNDQDHKKRTPLHYCVWNGAQNQVDLLRTLLDSNADPNSLDDDLRTPLHHCAQGGRTRAIPILLQRGGLQAMGLRDKDGKLPLDLCINDRTRELLVVYSAAPLNHKPQDVEWMDQAVQGKKQVIIQQSFKELEDDNEIIKTSSIKKSNIKQQVPKQVRQQKIISQQQQQYQQQDDDQQQNNITSWGPCTINEWIRQKLFVMLKKVQESGVVSNHHLKKPYIYTGSWMEGLNTMEELYESLKDITPGEVTMRIFNVLCPYDRPLPQKTGVEEVVDGFYGEQWYDSSTFGSQKRNEENERFKRQLQLQYVNRISELEVALKVGEESIKNSDEQMGKFKVQIELLQKQLDEKEQSSSIQIETLTQQLKNKEGVLQQQKLELAKAQNKVRVLQNDIDYLKNTPKGPSQEDIQQYLDEIDRLKQSMDESQEQERQQRARAGQVFLKCINDERNAGDQKLQEYINSKKNQVDIKQSQTPPKIIAQSDQISKQQQINEQIGVGGIENMQDDDAIILLLKALKGNPPQMRQRMRDVDKDADGKLVQNEFQEFLVQLKIGATDQQSLFRIAGFLNGRRLLGIEEWVQILQDRPKQREQWEQKLFARLLEAIKARNLGLDHFFELLDSDDSGQLTPAELRQGLKQLKIVLNQNDMNNLFCVFDADKNGLISLNEMKSTLDNFQKIIQQQNGGEGSDLIDAQDRLQDREQGDIIFEDIACQDQLYKEQDEIEQIDWVVDENDTTILNGYLFIQIPKAEALLNQTLLKSITIKAILLGSQNEITKSFIVFDSSIFNQVLCLDVKGALRENMNQHMILQFYRGDMVFDEDHFLGDVRVLWKQCLDNIGAWSFNYRVMMANRTFLKATNLMKKVSGSVWVQLKYVESKESLIQNLGVVAQDNFIGTIVEEGYLEIIMVQCIVSKENRMDEKSNFYFDMSFMDISKSEVLGKRTAKNDIYWDTKYIQELRCKTNEAIQNIKLRVYAKQKKNLIQSTTRELGQIFIDWSECIKYPGSYNSRKSFLLNDSQKLYAKIRYIPKSMMQNIVGFKANVSEADKKKQLKLEDMQEGTLKVLFVRGKNLPADDGDTSDPYVLLKFDSFDKEIKIQSKTIKKTINPEWKDLQQFTCLIPKEPPYPPLQLQVFDEDLMVGGDDLLGSCKIDLAPAIESPCTWAINELFELKLVDPSKQTAPSYVYIQSYWVPKGQKDPNLKAKDKEDQVGGMVDQNIIDGTILLKLIHARELDVGGDETPDPYCTITFPGGNESKSNTISSTHNPLWNQLLTQNIKLPRPTDITQLTPLKIFVKDSNFLRDAVIGYCDVNWGECLQKSGDWAVNQVFKLSGSSDSKGQLGSLGFIYFQIKFIERGMIDDDSQAPLVENLPDMISNKQGIWQGTLRVFLIHCKDLIRADSGSDELCDPYVVFKVPGGKKLESKAIKKSLNPSWKTIYLMQLSMPKDTIQPLRLEVYDDDLISDEFIGYASADLSQCFQNPQKWAFNQILPLKGDMQMQQKYKTSKFGSIYIQIMFCLQGIDCQDPPLQLTEDIDQIMRERAQENKKLMKGKLYINIPLALGIRAADSSTKTSDPYCKIKLPDEHSIETKQIDKCVDPIWNFSYVWNCNIIKEQYKPLNIQIFDKDTLATDDVLGSVDVDWIQCFTNPTLWEFNSLIPLNGEKQLGEDLGKVYVQLKFLLDGQERTPEGMKSPETIPELRNQYGRVLGTVHVKIISARSLLSSDLIGKSDPFVETYLSTDTKKRMKTCVIQDNLNPEFNFDGSLYIDLLRCQVKSTKICFDVLDDDEIGSDFLGQVIIDVIDILEQNPESQLIADYPLKDSAKKGNPDLGTLKVSLAWQPDPSNEGVVGIREPQKIYDGELIINYPAARLLPKGDPYINFFLTNQPDKIYSFKDKHLKSNINPDFEYTQQIQINGLTEVQLKTLRLTTTVMSFNLIIDTKFGGQTISLYDIFQKSTWINDYYQLYNKDGDKMESYIYIQAAFKSKDQPDIVAPPKIDFKAWKNEASPPTINGKFVFTYVGLKKIKNTDITGASDPFVEIIFSKGSKQSFKTSTQDDKIECFWEKPGTQELNELLQDDLDNLRLYISVYDYDYNSNDLIGKCEFDLVEVVKQNGSWINQQFALFDEKNFPEKTEIYIQAQWLQDGLPIPDIKQPLNIYEDIKQKLIAEQKQKKDEEAAQAAVPKYPGIVKILIDQSKNLIKADIFDDSDPFAEIKISKGDKNVLKTKTIDNEKNPKWNFEGEFRLNLQQQEYNNMNIMVTVYDYDFGRSDEFLGFIEINIDEQFKYPGQWLNQIYQLKDEHGMEGKNGQISVKISWIPDDKKNILTLPPATLDFNQQQQQIIQSVVPTTIQGSIQINLIRVTQMPSDKKAQAGITILGTEKKTNMVQNDVNWNYRVLMPLMYVENDPKAQLAYIILYDETQNQVATLDLDISAILKNPGNWINGYFNFRVNNLKPSTQQIYVQIQWRPNGVQIDTTEPQQLSDPSLLSIQQIAQPNASINLKGLIKIAVIGAQKILLLDNGKSNTKCIIEYDGNDYSTPSVKAENPVWNIIQKFTNKNTKIDDLKPILVKLSHDPGFLKSSIIIGETSITDFKEIFYKPSQWAIKQDYLLQSNSKTPLKQPVTGFVTLQIGFIPDKQADNLTAI